MKHLLFLYIYLTAPCFEMFDPSQQNVTMIFVQCLADFPSGWVWFGDASHQSVQVCSRCRGGFVLSAVGPEGSFAISLSGRAFVSGWSWPRDPTALKDLKPTQAHKNSILAQSITSLMERLISVL